MATCNFSKRNAKAYYVIKDSEIEDRLDFLMYDGEDNGMYKDPDGLLYKDYSFRFGRVSDSLCGMIDYNPGYYEYGNLDWDISYNSYGNEHMFLSDYEDIQDFAGAVAEYIADEEEVEDKAGLENEIAKKLHEIINELEVFCKDNCDEVYSEIGRFSNGCAIYEKVA